MIDGNKIDTKDANGNSQIGDASDIEEEIEIEVAIEIEAEVDNKTTTQE